LQAVVPDLDQRVYTRARSRERKQRLSSPEFAGLYEHAGSLKGLATGDPVIVVVPPEGPSHGNWEPAQWNIYYEAYQRLKETHGDHRVLSFFVEPGEAVSKWQRRLIDFVADQRATHLLTHVEKDPESDAGEWAWDTFWEAASRFWGGVFLGGMFDSSYRFTEAKAKVMARMSPNFVLVDICMPMDGSLRARRPEVGPVNIPMSEQTLTLVDEYIAGQTKEFDISFIGVLYDYRVELVDRLRSLGLNVAVNPHRQDDPRDADATRRSQPSWLDYMRGLASSRSTINFSRSNAGPFEQLKTRVVEVGLAGSYLFTDDRDRTRRFWDEQTFSMFDSPDQLAQLAQEVLTDTDEVIARTDNFRERARYLARHHYWGEIEAVLRARGLPSLGIEPFSS
jgi:hypothetical protein